MDLNIFNNVYTFHLIDEMQCAFARRRRVGGLDTCWFFDDGPMEEESHKYVSYGLHKPWDSQANLLTAVSIAVISGVWFLIEVTFQVAEEQGLSYLSTAV